MASRIHKDTGEDVEKIGRKIEGFFCLLRKKAIEKGCSQNDFEIRHQGIYHHPQTLTDDQVHMLLYKDQPIGIVTETRTEFNRIEYTFFNNLENIFL